MSLSANARKILDRLPNDGQKIGGITLQRELSLSKLDYQKGRDELKVEGLVVAGQGRGGSLGRVPGTEPEEEPTATKAERMAFAREAKAAKSQMKRETRDLIDRIVQYCHDEGYPRVQAKDVSFSNNRPVIAVWDESHSRAQMHTIPQLDYDKLRANYR